MSNRSVESWLPLDTASATDVGCVREANEDSYSIVDPPDPRLLAHRGRLLLVADGMGGALGGERASSIVTHLVPETYYRRSEGLAINEALREAIEAANREVYASAARDPDLRGMGSTCTAAVVHDDALWYAHVGDSRLYLIRDRTIEQLTTDHSKIARLVADRVIGAAEAAVHPERSVLLRSIGPRPTVEVDVADKPRSLRGGDRLLLCSDGLSGTVTDEEMLEIVDSKGSEAAVEALIELAKSRGGEDNITVQIARVGGRRPPTTQLPGIPATDPSHTPETLIEAPGVEIVPPRRRSVQSRLMLLTIVLLVAALAIVTYRLVAQSADRSPHRAKPAKAPAQRAASPPPAAASTVPVRESDMEPEDAGSPDAAVDTDAEQASGLLDDPQTATAMADLKRQQKDCPDFIGELKKRLKIDPGDRAPEVAIVRAIAQTQAKARHSKRLTVDGRAGPGTQRYLFKKVICPQ